MSAAIWIGIAGSALAVGFAANGMRMISGGSDHAANAGRLHIVMAALFVAILWAVVLLAMPQSPAA